MPKGYHSFTTTFNGISKVLYNEVNVTKAYNPKNPPKDVDYKKYLAIWDTGATNTVITEKVVKECGLKPTGITRVCTVGGEQSTNTYMVNILLVNKVEVYQIKVTEGKISGDADVLIGMDIIGSGDFAVTNKNDKTVFSFRIPSLECIDFVKNPYKETPVKSKPKIGRNDPCPCGSGKKYKNCCMKKV